MPKAPIVLYAVESVNPYKKAEEELKFELAKLNKCLWLGEMLPTFDLVIPFNSLYMQQTYPGSQLVSKYLGKLSTADSVYHRSALQSLVQQAVTQRSVPPASTEAFRDINGRNCMSMKDIISSILYMERPNIVLPSIQFPLWKKEGERWSENL